MSNDEIDEEIVSWLPPFTLKDLAWHFRCVDVVLSCVSESDVAVTTRETVSSLEFRSQSTKKNVIKPRTAHVLVDWQILCPLCIR